MFRREWLLSVRDLASSAQSLWFFLLVVMLFPLGLGPDSGRLAELAPGLIWVIALLAAMLAADGLFRDDYADGSLEQMILGVQPLYFIVLAKLLTRCLVIGLPLALCSPLLGLLLGLNTDVWPVLVLSLLLGLPVLLFLGAVGSALTVGFQRGGLLLSLLILPLYVPVLIFGAGAVQAAAQGMAYGPQLAVLAGMLSLAVGLVPLAVSAALKLHYYY